MILCKGLFAAATVLFAATTIVADPYPYLGPLSTHALGADSCGVQLAPGSQDAPLYDDCVQASKRWQELQYRQPKWGRQTMVYKSCVVVWWPRQVGEVDYVPGISSVEAIDIMRETNMLITACQTGADGEYASNYAYHWDKNGVGTVALYNVVDLPENQLLSWAMPSYNRLGGTSWFATDEEG